MQYVLITRAMAAKYGYREFGRAIKGDNTVLTEAEVMSNKKLTGSFEERVAELGGTAMSHDQIKAKIL